MSTKIKKSISYTIIMISIAVTALIVSGFNIQALNGIQDSAVWVLFILLAIGIVGFFLNSTRLILTEFACAAILCVYLKSASNSALQMPVINDSAHFSIAHINLSSVESGYGDFIKDIKAKDLDIISFQELKPDWAAVLKESLVETMPYFAENVRIDLFGMSVFSKFPIVYEDTVLIDNIPFLTAAIELEKEKTISITNPLITPSINSTMDKTQKLQMEKITDYIQNKTGTKVVLGDFNMVYWSTRIRDFRNATGLMNSRRDISQSVLSIPYDHIFYSEDLECTRFIDLIDSTNIRLGIQADFQFTNNNL